MSKIERKLAEFTLDDFAKAEYYCWKADKELWEAEEEYEMLKEHGKDLLASLMTKFVAGLPERVKKPSETELERQARSSKEWKEHRDAEHEARKEKVKLKFKSRAADRFWSTIQSGLSFKRAELSKVGSQES